MNKIKQRLDEITENEDRYYWPVEKFIQIIELQAECLTHYAEHEPVIKEAYHSNDNRQITCVHTFINHAATEALSQTAKLLGCE